jgi:hypothetical protein
LKHLINPQIDCVFKAILGTEENEPLLISFLNGIVRPQSSIVSVEILNPYNEKEFVSDKLSIVDVKARDQQGRLFQVEIQMVVYPYLPARMLRNWNADIEQKKLLNDHCTIHGLELEKWQKTVELSIKDQWLCFFKEAKSWTELPENMNTPELRQAMATLRRFSEKEKAYDQYQAREEFIRDEKTKQAMLEDALKKQVEAMAMAAAAVQKQEEERQAKEVALNAKEAERQAKEVALNEQSRLRELLRKSGIDPDAN